MSYQCYLHGWRHILNPCPSCSSKIISNGNATLPFESVFKRTSDPRDEEIAALKAESLEYAKLNGRMLKRVCDISKENEVLKGKLETAKNFIEHAEMFSQCLATRSLSREALIQLNETPEAKPGSGKEEDL